MHCHFIESLKAFDFKVDAFNTALLAVFDVHAPLQTTVLKKIANYKLRIQSNK